MKIKPIEPKGRKMKMKLVRVRRGDGTAELANCKNMVEKMADYLDAVVDLARRLKKPVQKLDAMEAEEIAEDLVDVLKRLKEADTFVKGVRDIAG